MLHSSPDDCWSSWLGLQPQKHLGFKLKTSLSNTWSSSWDAMLSWKIKNKGNYVRLIFSFGKFHQQISSFRKLHQLISSYSKFLQLICSLGWLEPWKSTSHEKNSYHSELREWEKNNSSDRSFELLFCAINCNNKDIISLQQGLPFPLVTLTSCHTTYITGSKKLSSTSYLQHHAVIHVNTISTPIILFIWSGHAHGKVA
jgi:hypothetical protein